jgi:hypothetical protein
MMEFRRRHIATELIKAKPAREGVDNFQFQIEDGDLSILHFQDESAPEGPEIMVRAEAANQRLEFT